METKKKKTPRVLNMNSKAAKYFVANRLNGKSKSEAVRIAGISDPRNAQNIEKTQTYQILDRRYKDIVEERISMQEVAEEHRKNILQDQDKGAKNTAIKMYMDKVEPEELKLDDEDKMVVILRA